MSGFLPSSSKHYQDGLANENFFLHKQYKTYVEIGCDPLYSNTKLYDKYLGWKGLYIVYSIKDIEQLIKDNRTCNYILCQETTPINQILIDYNIKHIDFLSITDKYINSLREINIDNVDLVLINKEFDTLTISKENNTTDFPKENLIRNNTTIIESEKLKNIDIFLKEHRFREAIISDFFIFYKGPNIFRIKHRGFNPLVLR